MTLEMFTRWNIYTNEITIKSYASRNINTNAVIYKQITVEHYTLWNIKTKQMTLEMFTRWNIYTNEITIKSYASRNINTNVVIYKQITVEHYTLYIFPNLSWPLSLALTTTYWTGRLPSNQASGFSPLDKSQTADLPCFRSNSTSGATASGKSRTSSVLLFWPMAITYWTGLTTFQSGLLKHRLTCSQLDSSPCPELSSTSTPSLLPQKPTRCQGSSSIRWWHL